MTHLSPAEFIDAVEGRLTEARRSHLDGCSTCAARLASLGDALHDAAQAEELPEPSPLFWSHFSQRVSDAVRHTAPDARRWLHPSWAIACSVVLVAALIFGVRDSRLSRVVSAPALTPSSAGEVANTDDPAWSLLTDVAAAIEQDDPQAAPVAVRPSEVDRAVTNLSAAEREELRRLLQHDMRRAGG